MKKLSAFFLFFSVSAAFINYGAFAEKSLSKTPFQISPIIGEKCVQLPIEDLLEALTSYDQYATIDGVFKPGELMPQFGSMNFQEIDMFESQAKFLEIKGDDPLAKKYSEMKDAYVKIALQPITLGAHYKSVYPQFLIRCKSGWVGPGHHAQFQQTCKLVPSELNFSVDRFTLNLNASQGCGVGGTGVKVTYTLLITTIQEDVEAIKKAVADQNSIPKTLINVLFDQETFFSKYFTFFYDRGMEWAKSRVAAKVSAQN